MFVVSRSTKAPIEVIVPPDSAHSNGLLGSSARSTDDDLVDRLAGELVMRHVVGRRVLDLGHGAPRITGWVQSRAQTQTIVDAIDLGRGPTVALPFADASFDVVYSLRTLPHLGQDAATSAAAARSALQEIGRILVPYGTALVQLDNPRSLLGVYHGATRPFRAIDPDALVVESSRGITRFDTLAQFVRMLPATLELLNVHGVSLLGTSVARFPILGRLCARLEWWSRDHSFWVGTFSAHLLLVLQRIERHMR